MSRKCRENLKKKRVSLNYLKHTKYIILHPNRVLNSLKSTFFFQTDK